MMSQPTACTHMPPCSCRRRNSLAHDLQEHDLPTHACLHTCLHAYDDRHDKGARGRAPCPMADVIRRASHNSSA